jgi:hypothetical protein
MLKLKDILYEDKVDDFFEKIPFGSDKESISNLKKLDPNKYRNSNEEADTELEQELHYAVQSWLEASTPELGKTIYNFRDVIKLAQSENHFPEIFKPTTPNGTIVYRGLSNTNDELRNVILSSNPEEWVRLKNQSILLTTPVSYNPHNLAQSWTTSPSTAKTFSGNRYITKTFGVVLITKQNDEFAFNSGFLQLAAPGYAKNENEIIHLGKTFSNNVYVLIHPSVNTYLDNLKYLPKSFTDNIDSNIELNPRKYIN